MNPDPESTICALSTAPGRAGIAVVRLSGRESLCIARSVLKSDRESFTPRHATLVRFLDIRNGLELDEALATYFPGPHSYTGEDVVEISIHGSPVLETAILDALCRAGARMASPGEFTMRAFLNGRIDLVQAEAVRDVIEATTVQQAQVAARQRSGELSRQLAPIKASLIDLIVRLESTIEFAEEDLPIESRAALSEKLEETLRRIRRAIASYQKGRILRQGFRLAIAGRPNVGKSSLFNALLGRDRSIVTEVAGTTRDVVSEEGNLEGIPVHLADTAGVRESSDTVERLGVDRAFGAIADADLVLLVLDASVRRSAEDDALRNRLEGLATIVVANKADLPTEWSDRSIVEFAEGRPALRVSARNLSGIPELRTLMISRLIGDEAALTEGLLITNLRHWRCLEQAEENISNGVSALRSGMSEEFALADLHFALARIGEITGETTVDNLLGEIFSRFCIGK
jgi:tRNA modification GTPase